MNTGLIYKATSPSGKCYIGQTMNLKERQDKHRSSSLNDSDKNREYDLAFHSTIRKYGFENIKWEIIQDNIPEDLLDIVEIYQIIVHDSYENGLNETMGGKAVGRGEQHPMFGREPWNKGKKGVYTQEQLKRMSSGMKGRIANNKGKPMSEEQKIKLSLAHKNKKLTDEHKNNISKSITGKNNHWFGKHHSEESKEKIRQTKLKNNKDNFNGKKI
jgi:group I intron endonuclease